MSQTLPFVLTALSLVLGLACGESSGDTRGTGGTAAGGSSGAAGAGGTSQTTRCPASPPSDGEPCEQEGVACSFGESSRDYLCTSEHLWSEREYVPASGNGGEGGGTGEAATGGAGGTFEQPQAVVCELYSLSECPLETGQCEIGCGIGNGGDGSGCVGACLRKPCGMLAAENCPEALCRLVSGCDDELACAPIFASTPECGVVTYYGQEVECCEGLELRCGAVAADGSCDPTTGGYGLGVSNVPWCVACGDGTCEIPAENACSCPEDCSD